MTGLKTSFLLLLGFLLISSCRNRDSAHQDSPTSGTAGIAVDETIMPVISGEIDVFESIYTTAGILAAPCPEIDAFNLLLKDSVRMIIVSRKLSAGEEEHFKNKKIFPKQVKIAVDAVTFIVNKANDDTLITVDQIRKILTGEISSWKELNPQSPLGKMKVVFDHPRSGTAQYAVREICKGRKLSAGLSSLSGNPAVFEYVAQTPNSIGIIGVNWISDHSDSTCRGFLNNVRVVAVSKEETATIENSFQPYQAYLATGQYPFTRDVFAIVADPRVGLTSGFTSFLTSDRGQKIILKSGILPATQPMRIIHVNDN